MSDKSFLIIARCKDLARNEKVVEKLKERGSLEAMKAQVSDGNISVWKYTPDEDWTIADVRDIVRENIEIFEDGFIVTEIEPTAICEYASGISLPPVTGHCKGSRAKRNIERFNTKKEAYLTFLRENPRWVYDGSRGAPRAVDFDKEWLWLPVKPDGIYPNTLSLSL